MRDGLHPCDVSPVLTSFHEEIHVLSGCDGVGSQSRVDGRIADVVEQRAGRVVCVRVVAVEEEMEAFDLVQIGPDVHFGQLEEGQLLQFQLTNNRLLNDDVGAVGGVGRLAPNEQRFRRRWHVISRNDPLMRKIVTFFEKKQTFLINYTVKFAALVSLWLMWWLVATSSGLQMTVLLSAVHSHSGNSSGWHRLGNWWTGAAKTATKRPARYNKLNLDRVDVMSAVQVLTGALFTQRLKYLFFPFHPLFNVLVLGFFHPEGNSWLVVVSNGPFCIPAAPVSHTVIARVDIRISHTQLPSRILRHLHYVFWYSYVVFCAAPTFINHEAFYKIFAADHADQRWNWWNEAKAIACSLRGNAKKKVTW